MRCSLQISKSRKRSCKVDKLIGSDRTNYRSIKKSGNVKEEIIRRKQNQIHPGHAVRSIAISD
uniref:Uncharacterized protein n=1 Tax=Arundo donax TaxID=35708 RepID=A0A0A9HJ31_ARUDO